ncbi:MAG: hypothetical protein M9944_20130 [Rhizobiaceae bacterium]|nr:hypothetical protein [Rhizobiaceae bacterium]
MSRGGSRGKQKPSLSDLSRSELTIEELELWKQELSSGTDRACALVAAAYLDHVLQTAIKSYFRADFEPNDANEVFSKPQAPLSSLSGKIDVAFALAHFGSKERGDLHAIRRIRNAFAHSPRPIEFTHDLIALECNKLSVEAGYASPNASSHREKFILRCLDLVLTIQTKSQSIWESKVREIRKKIDGLSNFRDSIRDPSNPLNPLYNKK